MQKELKNKICKDILCAYVDLHTPDFSFVLRRIKDGIYFNFTEEFEKVFKVEDLSDFNHDICYSLSLKDSGKKNYGYGVNISLVGPFAFIGRPTNEENYIVTRQNCNNQKEKFILDILEKNEIIIMSLDDLKTKLPVEIDDIDFENQKSNLVFNVLFYRNRTI